MAASVESLKQLLRDAARAPLQRAALIAEFRDAVWSADVPREPGRAWEILQELAYDLEFFVAEMEARGEDASYYGHGQAEREIELALEKLDSMSADSPSGQGPPT